MKLTPLRRGPRPVQEQVIAGVQWPAGWQKESSFQRQVEDLFAYYGWLTSHSHLPFYDTAGWPDIAAICTKAGKERALFVELKVRDKKGRLPKPSPAQYRWISAMLKAGLDVKVWSWPDSWSEITQELAR